MTDLRKFWDEFMVRFSRAPVWLPGTAMAPGDVGTIDHRGWLRLTHLTDFDIEPCISVDADAQSEYDVTSKDAFVWESPVESSAGGLGRQPAPLVKVDFEFRRAQAYVLRAKRVEAARVNNTLEVERQILTRQARNPFWGRNWIYVQEVVTAQPCLMIVSDSGGAKATVTAHAPLGAEGLMGAFGVAAGLALQCQSEGVHRVVSEKRAAFMWRGRWAPGLFRSRFVSRAGSDEELGCDSSVFEPFDEPELFGS